MRGDGGTTMNHETATLGTAFAAAKMGGEQVVMAKPVGPKPSPKAPSIQVRI